MSGSTPLHLAVDVEADAEDAAAECVNVLLDYGGSTKVKDANGRTPLKVAKLPAIRKVLSASAAAATTTAKEAAEPGAKETSAEGDADKRAGEGRRRRTSSDDKKDGEGRRRRPELSETAKELDKLREAESKASGKAASKADAKTDGKVVSAVASRTDERRKRRGQEGSSSAPLSESGRAREEKKLNELLRLREKRDQEELEAAMAAEAPLGEEQADIEWDVVLELLPEYAAVEALTLERPELEGLEEAREIEVTRSTVLRAVGGVGSEHLSSPRSPPTLSATLTDADTESLQIMLIECASACRRRRHRDSVTDADPDPAGSSRPTRAAST